MAWQKQHYVCVYDIVMGKDSDSTLRRVSFEICIRWNWNLFDLILSAQLGQPINWYQVHQLTDCIYPKDPSSGLKSGFFTFNRCTEVSNKLSQTVYSALINVYHCQKCLKLFQHDIPEGRRSSSYFCAILRLPQAIKAWCSFSPSLPGAVSSHWQSML